LSVISGQEGRASISNVGGGGPYGEMRMTEGKRRRTICGEGRGSQGKEASKVAIMSSREGNNLQKPPLRRKRKGVFDPGSGGEEKGANRRRSGGIKRPCGRERRKAK